ncbi:hypothetical protein BC936DRAFT_143956 [Jimgerdemannia flammicorona]|uniref:DUF2421 domain-containing protein n=1 Tax=Jimgerdemannia flammicorona TaxID=994334 RepID=A0A432ZYG4_9FUNG|nr:hypothetical protein BC936DRAFT_143956 [Jimgerdemannia flammicorona]
MVIATYIHTSEDTSAVATEEEVKLLEKTEKKLQIVNSVQNLLDRLVSLRSAAKFISLEIQKELCGPLKVYRRDMAAAIVLYFHILAGSLISKTPLPPYFPSARIARIRVINRLRQSSDTMPLTGGAGLEYRNLYWYAYMSSMEEIIEELENLSVLVKLITGKPKLLHRIGAMGDERNKEGQDEGVEDEGAKGRSMGYEG